MPPRAAISGVQAALTPSTWRTTSSTPAALVSRFSTTSPTSGPSSTVPPVSPNYIKVPEPPQSSEPKLPPIRGHLPIPRQVFTSRDGAQPARVSPTYVSTIKPKSAAEQAGLPPANQHEARRRVLAEARRKSLEEGLQGLWQRKTTTDKRAADRAARHARQNIHAAMQPERKDEILTRPTVRASTASVTHVPLDPNRFEDAEKAKAAHDAKLAVKAEERRDALCQMYMAAGKFIVDEAELQQRIDAVFNEQLAGRTSDASESIWIHGGAPATVRSQVANVYSTTTDVRRSESGRTVLRQKTVAEALTGGKL